MNKRKRRRIGAWKWGVLGALCAAAVAVCMSAQIESNLHEQELALIRSQLQSAAVSCYASEGRFPQELSYLKENYGLVYDEARYSVQYDAFASNIMPDIDVSVRGEKYP